MFGRKRSKNSHQSPAASASNAAGRVGWTSSLTLFYGLMLLLLSIPLIMLFAVLFIRALFDYRAWILGAGAALLALGLFLFYRNRSRLKRHILKESSQLMEVIQQAAREGQTVQVSFLGGLMNITYGDGNGAGSRRLPWTGGPRPLPPPQGLQGPSTAGPSQVLKPPPDWQAYSLARELEDLHRLKERGVLTEKEYRNAKKRLLKEAKL